MQKARSPVWPADSSEAGISGEAAGSTTQIPLSSLLKTKCSVFILTDVGECPGCRPHITRRQYSRGLKTQAVDSERPRQKSYFMTMGKFLPYALASSSGTWYYCSKYLLLHPGGELYSLTSLSSGLDVCLASANDMWDKVACATLKQWH